MSHSKHTKRGGSIYLDKWNPSAKKYINTCCLCGATGFSSVVLDYDFYDKNSNLYSESRAIYKELTKTLNQLALDDWGRCEICAKIQK